MRKSLLLFCLIVAMGPLGLFGQTAPIYGPENGSLLIVGGGFTTNEMIQRMAELMGGFDQPLVVVPTATDPNSINIAATQSQWENRGFTDVTVLHTTDPSVANTESFVAPLKVAKGVWFGGGRQWRLVDAYLNTLTLDEFHNVLDRGGLIAGSSAGASIQASFLARGAEASNVPIISPELEHRVGFGFLKNSAIDQHIDARDRWEEMEEIIVNYPDLLGIGLSETTAILVQGDCFEVLGVAQVAITDSTRLNDCQGDSCYEILVASDSFNIVHRLKGSCDLGPNPPSSVNSPDPLFALQLYPNPASGSFRIESAEQQITGVSIFNLLGAEVSHLIRWELQGRQATVETYGLEAGAYLVQVSTEKGAVVKRVLIE